MKLSSFLLFYFVPQSCIWIIIKAIAILIIIKANKIKEICTYIISANERSAQNQFYKKNVCVVKYKLNCFRCTNE